MNRLTIRITVLAALFAAPALAGESRTLAALERVPVYSGDTAEPVDERRVRLGELAQAIDGATHNRDERAMLVALAIHESGLARYVQLDLGACSDGASLRCDRGKAWSPWQLHGTDRTGGVTVAAQIAVSKLRGARRVCEERHGKRIEPVAAALSLYGTGSTCQWPGVSVRVATYRRIVGTL